MVVTGAAVVVVTGVVVVALKDDGLPVPTAFTADTRIVYEVPTSRPCSESMHTRSQLNGMHIPPSTHADEIATQVSPESDEYSTM